VTIRYTLEFRDYHNNLFINLLTNKISIIIAAVIAKAIQICCTLLRNETILSINTLDLFFKPSVGLGLPRRTSGLYCLLNILIAPLRKAICLW
jgi:hypothetical protein